MKARDIVIALWIKCDGDWDKIYQMILKKEDIDVKEYLKDVDTTRYITILDEEYPKDLKMSYKPPFVLERA